MAQKAHPSSFRLGSTQLWKFESNPVYLNTSNTKQLFLFLFLKAELRKKGYFFVDYKFQSIKNIFKAEIIFFRVWKKIKKRNKTKNKTRKYFKKKKPVSHKVFLKNPKKSRWKFNRKTWLKHRQKKFKKMQQRLFWLKIARKGFSKLVKKFLFKKIRQKKKVLKKKKQFKKRLYKTTRKLKRTKVLLKKIQNRSKKFRFKKIIKKFFTDIQKKTTYKKRLKVKTKLKKRISPVVWVFPKAKKRKLKLKLKSKLKNKLKNKRKRKLKSQLKLKKLIRFSKKNSLASLQKFFSTIKQKIANQKTVILKRKKTKKNRNYKNKVLTILKSKKLLFLKRKKNRLKKKKLKIKKILALKKFEYILEHKIQKQFNTEIQIRLLNVNGLVKRRFKNKLRQSFKKLQKYRRTEDIKQLNSIIAFSFKFKSPLLLSEYLGYKIDKVKNIKSFFKILEKIIKIEFLFWKNILSLKILTWGKQHKSARSRKNKILFGPFKTASIKNPVYQNIFHATTRYGVFGVRVVYVYK